MADSNNKLVPGQFPVSTRLKTICFSLMFLGAATFVIMMLRDRSRGWYAYLIAYYFFFVLAIGGLFFTCVQHAVHAGWSVNVRRFCEAFTSFLPWTFGGALFLLIGGSTLYDWLDKAKVAHSAVLQQKEAYLNWPFFVIRVVVFFALWLFFTKKIVGFSLTQDKTGEDELSNRAAPWSIVALVIFALTFSFFSVDLIMALQAEWFSTIFGVYCFAGLFQATIAAMILVVVYCMKKGLLTGFVDENHLHDLGKFLFAFTIFWAYIAYSQYMLIWYANLPEETSFFLPRLAGSWVWISIALVTFKFVVPFFALLSRSAKRNSANLVAVSIMILVMQYVDLYWLIYPNLNESHPVFGLPEILIFCGIAGAFVLVVAKFLNRNSLVPIRDPRIHESLHHHVVY